MKIFLSLLLALSTTALATSFVEDTFTGIGALSGHTVDSGGGHWTGDSDIWRDSGVVTVPKFFNDVQYSFAARSGTTVYAGFSFCVTESPAETGNVLFSFLTSGTRVSGFYVLPGADASTCRVAIDNKLDGGVEWPAALETNKWYRAVVGLRESGSTDSSKLWINPVDISSPFVTDSTESFVGTSPGITGITLHGDTDGARAKVSRLVLSGTFENVASVLGDFGQFDGTFRGTQTFWKNGVYQKSVRAGLESEGGFAFTGFQGSGPQNFKFNLQKRTWTWTFSGGSASGSIDLESSPLKLKGTLSQGGTRTPVRIRFEMRPDGKLLMKLTGVSGDGNILWRWVGTRKAN